MSATTGRGGSSVSVVISTYTGRRWDDLLEAVASVQRPHANDVEVIIVVDHNERLLKRAERRISDARVVPNRYRQGLSGARNTGIAEASGAIVAFLDDDARAEPDWLHHLRSVYTDPAVIAVGGQILPDWEGGGRPANFPAEFDWVVGCTYLGMPIAREPVRNIIGANMTFRREVFDEVGGFDDALGRIGTLPAGCEETELCIRVRQALPGHEIVYEPRAVVHHRVPSDRARASYLFRRCLAEGRSKARVAAIAGGRDALSTERRYASRVLPLGIARGIADVARGDRCGAARATLIVCGALLTAGGYALERLRSGGPSTHLEPRVARVPAPATGVTADRVPISTNTDG
jgi:GT2 family glycosyltransferase